MKPAVILLSGGLDSAVTAALAREAGFELYGLTVNYGQRHVIELKAASEVARSLGVREHVELRLDLRVFGNSSLTSNLPVEKSGAVEEIAGRIPSTYVPARNTIFLSLALGFAEVRGASDIFVGVNSVDYSGYPDCRPEFIGAFESMACLATRAALDCRGIRLHAPLQCMNKAAIIREGLRLGVDFAVTHSCYDPDEAGRACGHCDSCLLRMQGFDLAGVRDPITYQV